MGQRAWVSGRSAPASVDPSWHSALTSPATCRGLTLTDDLHGKRATLEAVSPRLYVDFLDDIANHFVPGRVPPPAIGSRHVEPG